MKNITNYIEKHKLKIILITILSAAFIICAVLIPLNYKAAYSKHPLFGEDKIEFTNPLDNKYVNFELKGLEYNDQTFTTNNTYSNGNLKFETSLKAKKTLLNAEATYLITSNWDKEWETNQTVQSHIYSEKSITTGMKAITRTENLSIKRLYPFKPIMFVKVEKPTLYIKLSFQISKTVDSPDSSVDYYSLYFKYEFDDYKAK